MLRIRITFGDPNPISTTLAAVAEFCQTSVHANGPLVKSSTVPGRPYRQPMLSKCHHEGTAASSNVTIMVPTRLWKSLLARRHHLNFIAS